MGIHLKVGEMDLGTWSFFFVRLSVGIRQAQMDAHWSERSQGASSTRWLAHPLYIYIHIYAISETLSTLALLFLVDHSEMTFSQCCLFPC